MGMKKLAIPGNKFTSCSAYLYFDEKKILIAKSGQVFTLFNVVYGHK